MKFGPEYGVIWAGNWLLLSNTKLGAPQSHQQGQGFVDPIGCASVTRIETENTLISEIKSSFYQ